jgi:hypothetical protein
MAAQGSHCSRCIDLISVDAVYNVGNDLASAVYVFPRRMSKTFCNCASFIANGGTHALYPRWDVVLILE